MRRCSGRVERRLARVVSLDPLEPRQLFAVVISEFLAGNVNGLTDVDGTHSDWIELYNPTAAPVVLDGWGLTDAVSLPAKWTFPDANPAAAEVTLAPGARLVVFASNKDRRIPGQEFHTNFALGKGGEYLGIFPAGSATAEFEYAPAFPAQADDISFGVLDSDPTQQRFFSPPTPGAANTTAGTAVVADPAFSVQRGFFDAPFQLTLSTSTLDASIRYTTDGSPPSPTTGTLYTGALNITGTATVRAIAYKAGFVASSVETQTYIFLEQVIDQPKHVPGWPEPVIPIDNIVTNTRVHDYEMDPDVVNNPAYSAGLLKGLTDIPTMSLVVNQTDMWDPATGQGGFYRLDDVEKPVSVEIIYPNDPARSMQVNAGIEGQSHDRMKRSLRLKFKSEYGASHLKSTLFQEAVNEGSSAVDEIDSIVLRAGNNRAWSRSDNADRTTFTEDQFFRDSQIAMSGVGSHGNFVHLYINGLYWGLYNPSERPDDNFSAAYFGGEDSDYSAVKEDGVKDGDPTRFNYLRGALKDKNMAVLSNYQELLQYLDVQNFSDYLLLEWYVGNTDWPDNNWWEGNRNTPTAGPSRFYAWDGEWSLGVPGKGSPPTAWVHPDFSKTDTSAGRYDIPNIFNSAKASPEFKLVLADRAYKALANGGALTDAAVLARFDALNAYIRDAVIAESARWGDTVDPNAPKTRDVHWQNEINFIQNYLQGNAADMIAALRAEGYYPSINPATFSQRGGTVAAGFKLTLSNPNGSGGTIYYTLDGSDPRAVGGAVAAGAKAYHGSLGVRLTADAQVRARILSAAGEWSAGDQVAFTVTGTIAPQIDQQPAPQTVGVGQPATFSVSAYGTGPLTYQWQRNGQDIAGATGPSYTLAGAALADSGASFRVIVTSTQGLGTATSNAAALTVTQSSTTTLSAAAASYVRDGSFASQNFGNAADLFVKKSTTSGSTRETYLRFNLAGIGDVTSGVIRLFGKSSGASQGVGVSVFGVANTTWSETGITWNNRPSSGASVLASKTVAAGTSAWHEFDVTSYLRERKSAGATAVTFVLRGTTTTDPFAQLNSDENTSANKPQLVVNHVPATPQQPITLRATADTYVRDGSSAGLNFGTSGELQLKKNATGSNREIWLKFDLSSATSIASATLRLFGRIDSATQRRDVSVYSSSNTSWGESTLTWNSRPAAGTTALATQTIATSTQKYYEWDLTSFLQAEKAAGRNVVTLVLRSLTTTTPHMIFSSDETSANQPQLRIT